MWGAAYCGISALFGLGSIFAPSTTKSLAALYEGVKNNIKGELHVRKDYEDKTPENSNTLKTWMDAQKAVAGNVPADNVQQPPQVNNAHGNMQGNHVMPPQEQPLDENAEAKPDDAVAKHHQALAQRRKALADELLKDKPDMQLLAKLENVVRALTILVSADNVLADNDANMQQIQQGINDALRA
ncbi:MAG: hypothetical protein IJU37_08915 [Desulfovibrio sp.]|nr:hypothetical protein [Desulfovibrio sp.]